MILALDTSLYDLSIGLFTSDAEKLALFHHSPTVNERGVHDALLAATVAEMLKEAGAQAKEIKRILFIAGPGSFTGLRIGLAFAKGLAYATGASIVPVPSHVALQSSLDKKHRSAANILFAYPGYVKHSLYIAHAGAINDVALVPLRELLPDLTIAGPPSALELLAGKHEHTIQCNVDLASTVEQSIGLSEVVGFEQLAALEPLYITPFTPHMASGSGITRD